MRPSILGVIVACILFALPLRGPVSAGTGGSEPCPVCSGTTLVPCPTCAGKGSAVINCLFCGGAGTGTCPICHVSPEVLKTAGRTLKTGMLPCPNHYCHNGTVAWEDGTKYPCLLCGAKGMFDCPICDSGQSKCLFCVGRGKFAHTCNDCGGTGKLRCPHCQLKLTARSCSECGNAHAHRCELCGGSGSKAGSQIRCRACLGRGEKLCTACLGLKRVTCSGCGASGKERYQDAAGRPAGSRTHKDCKGTGWTACSACSNGFTPCGQCQKGIISDRCEHCQGIGVVPCSGCCFGLWGAFQTGARALRAAGRSADAREMAQEAMRSLDTAPIQMQFDKAGIDLDDSLTAGIKKRAAAQIKDLLDQIEHDLAKPAPKN